MKIFWLLFMLLTTGNLHAKTVYLVGEASIMACCFNEPLISAGNEGVLAYHRIKTDLEKAGFNVRFGSKGANLDDFSAIISFNDASPELLANISNYPRERCFLFSFEPPIICPHLYEHCLTNYFGKIYQMLDDVVDNKNYYKFYYPQIRLCMVEKKPDFNQKILCTLMNSNKNSSHPKSLYNERKKVIHFFEKLNPGEFDLYGPGWEGYRDWKGVEINKWETLKNYKFIFCYENMKDQYGYITEKIFEAFVSGCVPIYWGASNITDYIPQECFINRNAFSSEEELYYHLKNMDKDTHEGYLETIKSYLASPQAQLYSFDNFTNSIIGALSKF